MPQKISPPEKADTDRLAHRVVRIRALAEERLGLRMTGDESDLDAIQALLDGKVVQAADTDDLHCLGIAFGMCLCDAVQGLDWAIVEDEDGRDPALRYLTSTLLIFPMTMLSKRVEDGEKVDVRLLFRESCASLERLKSEASWPS